MRIATYNLLHGLPVLGAVDAGLIAPSGGEPVPSFDDIGPLRDAVRTIAADVLGMQEVDRHQPRSGEHDQVAEVADAIGAGWHRFVPSVRGTPGGRDAFELATDDDDLAAARGEDVGPLYGVGLVSRWPVTQWRSTRFDAAPFGIPLLVPAQPRPRWVRVPDEPRAAVAAVIETPYGVVSVATAHLSFVPGYNIRQLRALVRWLRDMPRPLLLIGDFNLPGALPRLTSGFEQLARLPTYPVQSPKVQFDHVLADGLPSAVAAMARAEVIRLPVSDHAALAVDLDLATGG